MKILTAGLNERDAAALGILAGLAIKGAQCEMARLQRGQPLPAADLYVLDLPALGLARWSVAAEADLLQLLHGRSAVLMRAVSENAWEQVHTGHHSAQVLCWLTKPYSSEHMREALLRAVRPGGRGAAPMPRAAGRDAVAGRSDPAQAAGQAPVPGRHGVPGVGTRSVAAAPAGGGLSRALQANAQARSAQAGALGRALDARRAVQAAPVAPIPAMPAPALAVLEPLCAGDIQALREAFPQLQGQALLSRMLEVLALQQPHELRLSLRHSVLLHPGEGWVASNASQAQIVRVGQVPHLAAAVDLRPLSSIQIAERLQRLALTPQALDPFLWSLAAATMEQAPLQLARDAQLQLHGFPDYTRLSAVPDLFIQLAAICVRLPQTLSGLQAAFPACDPQLIRRFAFCCAASGLGRLSLVGGPAALAVPSALTRPAVRVPVRQGFFAALFQKLF